MVDETKFMEALYAKQDEWLTEYEEELFNTPPRKHRVNRDQEISILRDKSDLILQHINEGDYRFSKEIVDEALKIIGHSCQEDSIEYKKLCYKAILMMRETNEIFMKKRLDDFLFRPKTIHHGSKPAAKNSGKRLSELIEEYLQGKNNKKEYSVRTAKDAKGIFAGVVRIIGDVYLQDINYRMMNDFIEKARSLRKGWNSPKNKGLAINKFIATTGEDTLSAITINNWISGYISPMFRHAVRLGYMDKNYAEGITIKNASDESADRTYFSNEQLELLFHSDDFRNDTLEKASHFWIPILGYVTGARIEELCQLKRKNVLVINGIQCISINEDDDDQSIKTKSAERIIPLHNILTDLNFLNYANKFKLDERIFPELVRVNERYSHGLSSWFGDYTVHVGVRLTKDGESVFHSFRHGIVSYAANQDLREDMRKRYTGHRDKSPDATYKKIAISALKEHFVDKLILPVSLDHLRNSKWTK